jgi:hypothetical protein
MDFLSQDSPSSAPQELAFLRLRPTMEADFSSANIPIRLRAAAQTQ